MKVFVSGIISLLVMLSAFAVSAQGPEARLLYREDFSGKLKSKFWHPEIEPIGESSVNTENGQQILNTAGGVTVWFTQKLKGNIRIEYDWTVLVNGGKNDRLSDLNQFWMASDPRNGNLFARSGKFENYDSLSLYYVGYGGNANTTTRFRKYHGNGQKPLLKEYLDAPHLLKANHRYHVVITVIDGKTTFSIDGAQLFELQDPKPLTEGYFGFRSTASRHAIDHFVVYKLK